MRSDAVNKQGMKQKPAVFQQGWSCPATWHSLYLHMCAWCRFELLCRVRIARGFGTLVGRRQLVKQRLLAFNVLLQCSPTAGKMNVAVLPVSLSVGGQECIVAYLFV